METGSILIKESANAYKISDRVSQNVLGAQVLEFEGLKRIHRSIQITKFIRYHIHSRPGALLGNAPLRVMPKYLS
jgi:hypothetical protein